MMIKGCLLSMFFLMLLFIEVCCLQWLLALFGFYFGFWTCIGIIFVIDLLIGCAKK